MLIGLAGGVFKDEEEMVDMLCVVVDGEWWRGHDKGLLSSSSGKRGSKGCIGGGELEALRSAHGLIVGGEEGACLSVSSGEWSPRCTWRVTEVADVNKWVHYGFGQRSNGTLDAILWLRRQRLLDQHGMWEVWEVIGLREISWGFLPHSLVSSTTTSNIKHELTWIYAHDTTTDNPENCCASFWACWAWTWKWYASSSKKDQLCQCRVLMQTARSCWALR